MEKGPVTGAIDNIVRALSDSPTKLEAVEQLLTGIEAPKSSLAKGIDEVIDVAESQDLRELLIAIRSAVQSKVTE